MNFWSDIYTSLRNNEKLVLLYVLQSEGSSPGRQGFKMFVSDTGEMKGSIGGGFMEHKLIELSKSLLVKGDFSPFIKRQIHKTNIEKDKSGMICSGEQTIAFYYLDKNLQTLVDSIITVNDEVLELTNTGIKLSNTNIENRFHLNIEHDTWIYKEQLNFQNKVYIIGGGHVGLALSQTMKNLGFYVSIFDDREGLNTFENNEFVDEKKIVSYSEIDKFIPEGDNIFLVLASFGFKPDEVCMRKLLGRKYKYFGVMGSEEKMKKLISNLLEANYKQSDIDEVHTPIGIPIHSKTPEEIAISIAAEIIKVKNS